MKGMAAKVTMVIMTIMVGMITVWTWKISFTQTIHGQSYHALTKNPGHILWKVQHASRSVAIYYNLTRIATVSMEKIAVNATAEMLMGFITPNPHTTPNTFHPTVQYHPSVLFSSD